jgi:anti-sigma factor RsiW
MHKALPVTEADIQRYVDRRLEDERRAAVADWLLLHPEDAARVAGYRRLGERWREEFADVLREPVPRELLAIVAPRPRWTRRLAWAAAASLIVALLGLATWRVFDPYGPPDSVAADMIARSALAHADYSAQPQQSLAWLSQRLHMKVEAPDLEPLGLKLVGARLLPGARAPAAMLMYVGAEGQRVSLYWGPEFRQDHETGLRYLQVARGERVYYWLDKECGYAIVSGDLGKRQLLRVALIAYAHLEK